MNNLTVQAAVLVLSRVDESGVKVGRETDKQFDYGCNHIATTPLLCYDYATRIVAQSERAMLYIYGLVDPETEEIRYIGKSIRPQARLANQCNERSNTYRCHWIQSLLARGLRPNQIILEQLPDGSDWQDAERRWIAYGRAQGWPLTNSTDGGDGVENLPPEVRQKIAQTWVGRKHRPESLVKIGAASRGRHHTDEHRERMRQAMADRTFTPEWLTKISHALRRLSDEQVREIRQMIADGFSQYVIAEKFGVHQGTISNINRRTSYADVT